MSDLIKFVKEKAHSDIKSDWLAQSGLDEAAFMRELSFAIQHLTANPYLQKCDPPSILKAVLNIAQTGLTLNPVLKYAYLVPRRDKNTDKLECCLDPGYQGLVKLLTDTGSVNSIEAHIIYAGDEIEVNLADPRKVTKHIPHFLTGNDKGAILGVYSVATLKDGRLHAEIMSLKDVYEIRDRAEAYKSYKDGKIKTTPWVKDEGEMIRKTVIKRHWKYLPKSDKTEKFAKAVDLDNIANGYYETVDYTDIGLIESLLQTSTLQPEEKAKIESELPRIEYKHQAQRILGYLSANQIDPRDRYMTTVKDTNEALDRAIANDEL
jgi:recombination protein RecT